MALDSNVFAQAVTAELDTTLLEDGFPPDDYILKDEIAHGPVTIFAGDFDLPTIYKNLHTSFTRTVTREGKIVTVTLAQLRADNTLGGQGIYTSDIFPKEWSDDQILKCLGVVIIL